VFFACAVYIFTRTIRTWRVVPVLIYLRYILAALLTIAVFMLLNPAWWDNPIARAKTVLEMRQILLEGQVKADGGYAYFADQVSGFLRHSFIVSPQYYESAGWENYIGDQIARYEASVWRGVSIGGTILGAVILCVMIAVGLWTLLRGRKTRLAARWLVGVWALATLLTTLLLTPLDWQRYYLPNYLVIGLLAGLGLTRIIQGIINARRKSVNRQLVKI